ncbi:hypothetical protein BRADI_4g12151v3 [Brachypodium distachyon]|uniref:Uncharacterized protein n=1 Tax=Brachypodium distachyon TaxID=15368 RepID=A0A2K2CMA2_BRADI|nr:hypothetical protein BRADI_4g12151v3 [Brachypodium distachyon]
MKVASRFFRVKPMAGRRPARPCRHHHYVTSSPSSLIGKNTISHNREIFMYKGDTAAGGFLVFEGTPTDHMAKILDGGNGQKIRCGKKWQRFH